MNNISKENKIDYEQEKFDRNILMRKKFKIPLLLMINEPVTKTSMKRVPRVVSHKKEHSQLGDEFNELQNFKKFDEYIEIDRNGYIGCFIDSDTPSRDLSYRIISEKIIPQICRLECGKINLKYAGLQYGYLCFCGQKYGRHGEATETVCQTPCSGNSSIACGGIWKNAVYHSIIQESDNKKLLILAENHTKFNIAPMQLEITTKIVTNQIIDIKKTTQTPQNYNLTTSK
ncbi:hypothetical protein HZS_3447 [Henneguya salminicola]|nr:hypothetical protein HZS_3447 [Henneguya salminicola]